MPFDKVPQKIDFPAGEKAVLAFWKEHGIFDKTLAKNADGETFVFFEGPPTANGTPHNGHVLTRVIKDLFPRYKTMRGYNVPRKAGWDTHGLPVEVEVEKELGIHGKEAIQEYGVEAFTEKCIESVFRYTDAWRELTERIGFWVDLDDAYVTYHQSYVESVWWALSRLFEKGLLYQGHKIVWWWPQGGTALSAGEVGLGYKEVDDPSIFVRFPVIGKENTAILAWTTTPWTLPSNTAVAVHPEIAYAYVKLGDETLIIAADHAEKLVPGGEVLATVPGTELVGLRYTPPFNYAEPTGGRAHEVIAADFVTQETGSGLVHMAPAFGEDDFKYAAEHGIGMLQLITSEGRFDERVTDFAGRFCKEADRDIIRNLKSRGILFREESYRHNYPFCWRADTDPLIQYARPAWFIRTTEVTQQAIANNQQINWIPEHIKDGRFGDWLRNNVDWALSRERFWGTPLNIWICDSCDHRAAPSSAADIERRNPDAFAAFAEAKAQNPSLSDHLKVHKPWIDNVTIPCEACGGTMHRVPEVIDCWFDSGCMPFAQWGYPHQNKEKFEQSWPADFISEAVDQTRGWFYSLLMISTLLFEERELPHPFKTCIVLGHVTDKNGKKESKSKGNYTPPDKILESDGADAMRWYFYAANPPWNNTRYSPEAVRLGQQEFLLKLRNVYAFFEIYANIDGFWPTTTPKRPVSERAQLDRWIIGELHMTLRDVTALMDDYRLYDAAQRLIALADGLSNWYVRRSRARFWAKEQSADKWDAYHTLWEVLTGLAHIAAPFVPFISEQIHQNLMRNPYPDAPESIHLADWPAYDEALIDEALSLEMKTVRDVVSLGLQTRATYKLKVRQPLKMVEIVLGHADLTARIEPYAELIADELNVKQVVFTQDAGDLVSYMVKPNYRALGPVFGKRMPEVRKALDGLAPDGIRRELAESGEYRLHLGDDEVFTLNSEHVQVTVQAKEGYAAAGGAAGVVILEEALDDALIAEGHAREVTSRIQALRKQADLDYTDRISVRIAGDATVLAACETWRDYIARETLADDVTIGQGADGAAHMTEFKVDGADVVAGITPA
ncbi:MAG: isoleucine--tRNA ligase [Deltaproteobacteria bacterium]|nr:MAG: isoleucine--tRNA ligase [Deltaproteobacteria bacterium]